MNINRDPEIKNWKKTGYGNDTKLGDKKSI